MIYSNHSSEAHLASADIRRRRRLIHGVSSYTLKVLLERLRLKGRRIQGARIALLGFQFDSRHPHAQELRAQLQRLGARVADIPVASRREKLDDDTLDALAGMDAVVIASDQPVFRAVRPREFREIGIDIVIPTDTRG